LYGTEDAPPPPKKLPPVLPRLLFRSESFDDVELLKFVKYESPQTRQSFHCINE
jgi:hypothetical protein